MEIVSLIVLWLIILGLVGGTNTGTSALSGDSTTPPPPPEGYII